MDNQSEDKLIDEYCSGPSLLFEELDAEIVKAEDNIEMYAEMRRFMTDFPDEFCRKGFS